MVSFVGINNIPTAGAGNAQSSGMASIFGTHQLPTPVVPSTAASQRPIVQRTPQYPPPPPMGFSAPGAVQPQGDFSSILTPQNPQMPQMAPGVPQQNFQQYAQNPMAPLISGGR